MLEIRTSFRLISYWKRLGVDLISVLRAMWNVYVKKSRQGGSTIEQQFVRVVTNRYEISISRKLREILLAVVVRNIFTKEEILNSYLSIAYFGCHMNGTKQAFSRLNIVGSEISINQACSLIARLKYPEPKSQSVEIIQKINCRASHITKKFNEQKCITIRLTWKTSSQCVY